MFFDNKWLRRGEGRVLFQEEATFLVRLFTFWKKLYKMVVPSPLGKVTAGIHFVSRCKIKRAVEYCVYGRTAPFHDNKN